MNDFWTGILNTAQDVGKSLIIKEIDDNGNDSPTVRPATAVAREETTNSAAKMAMVAGGVALGVLALVLLLKKG